MAGTTSYGRTSALIRPIIRDDDNLYSGKDIEALRVFALQSQPYRDVPTPSYPRANSGPVSGVKISGGMSIRAGTL